MLSETEIQTIENQIAELEAHAASLPRRNRPPTNRRISKLEGVLERHAFEVLMAVPTDDAAGAALTVQ